MSDWKPLPSSRLARRHPQGYLVVVPVDRSDPVPLECPVCEILMRDREDVISYSKNECCSYCEMMWVYPNLEKWIHGWRPDSNEIDRVRKQRMSSPTYMVS
jgi:predicted O-linked N-acetylglucosamine transferase (SPINDLY family)